MSRTVRTEYIEAPDEYEGNRPIHFLAGGISNCPDWQQEISDYLQKHHLNAVVVNPRRKNFPMGNIAEGIKQIEWEAKYLKKAHTISFWFPAETMCPITLFELGSWSMTDKKIFVGFHQFYPRRLDLQVQIPLRKPGFDFANNIEHLAHQILGYYHSSEDSTKNE